MAIIGTNGQIIIKDGQRIVKLFCVTSFTIEKSLETLDVTCLDNDGGGWRKFEKGLENWQCSLVYAGNEELSGSLELTLSTGTEHFGGTVEVTSVSLPIAVADISYRTVNFQGTGKLYSGLTPPKNLALTSKNDEGDDEYELTFTWDRRDGGVLGDSLKLLCKTHLSGGSQTEWEVVKTLTGEKETVTFTHTLFEEEKYQFALVAEILVDSLPGGDIKLLGAFSNSIFVKA